MPGLMHAPLALDHITSWLADAALTLGTSTALVRHLILLNQRHLRIIHQRSGVFIARIIDRFLFGWNVHGLSRPGYQYQRRSAAWARAVA